MSGMAEPHTLSEEERLRSFLTAILHHGSTMWSDSSCGTGRPAGQTITSEAHPEVVEHLTTSALRGHTLKDAADQWEAYQPNTVRLDERPAPPRRRGPDGRPAK